MSGFLLLLVKVNLAMGAAIVLVSLIRRSLRAQFGAPIAYAIWLLVPIASVASLLPPREVPAPAHVASMQAPAVPAPVTGYVPTLSALEQLARPSVLMPSTPMKPPRSSYELFDLSPLLFAAWVLGLLVMAAYLTRVQIGFSTAVRRGEAGPAVLGFFRPRIVTPGGFEDQFTPQEQAAILAHERVHLARQDARINALVALLRCLCWFNPLIHLGARWLRIDQELACDAIAVSASVSHQTYAKALLKSQLMVGVLPFGCNWPGPQHPLVERIALLQRKPPGTARRFAGISLILLTATSAGLGAWAAQPPVAAKSMAPRQPGMAPATSPAVLAAQDRTIGTASSNPTGSGNDVDALKNVPASKAISAARVAHTLGKVTPNPVVTTNARVSVEQAPPPTTESSTAAANQVAINQAARLQTNDAATTSADPAVQPPAPAVALNGQPASPPTALDRSVGPVQAGLGTPPAAPPNFDPNEPYEIRRCIGSVTGRVTSSTTVQIPGFGCGGFSGSGVDSAGNSSGAYGGLSLRSGPCKRPRTFWAAEADVPVPAPSCPMRFTMTVQLANSADASKMPLGKLVTLKGNFRLITQNKVFYLLMQNARVLYADPFGR